MCVLKPLYYSGAFHSRRLLPVKNGIIFNPEYQHARVAMWSKVSTIDFYHEIKEEVRSAQRNGSWAYDRLCYSVGNKLNK